MERYILHYTTFIRLASRQLKALVMLRQSFDKGVLNVYRDNNKEIK